MSAPRGSVFAQCVLSDILRYWHTLEAMAGSQKNVCTTLNSHILDYTHHELMLQTILIYKPERLQKSSQPLERLRPVNDVIQLFCLLPVVNKTLEDHPIWKKIGSQNGWKP